MVRTGQDGGRRARVWSSQGEEGVEEKGGGSVKLVLGFGTVIVGWVRV